MQKSQARRFPWALLVAATLLLALAATGVAQTSTPPAGDNAQADGHRHHQHDAMRDLNLSESQRSQMQSIRQNERQQMEAIRANSSLSEEQKEAQVRQLKQSTHSQMLGILTPEQQQKLKAEHRERKHGGYKHRPAPPQ